MVKLNKRKCCTAFFVMVLLLATVALRVTRHQHPVSAALPLLQNAIYIGLFIAWGISVRKRVMQIQARKLLTIITGLILLWFVIRMFKYEYVTEPILLRYLWYLYYLPMLFIPLCALFSAMLLGQSEMARLPKYTVVLAGISVVLFLFVMTNDLHQLVFTFPEGKPWTSADYGYAPIYYMIVAWLLFCGFAILVMLLFKCRIPHSRKYIWLPGVPIAVLLVYTVLYLLRIDWLFELFGDLPAVFCLLYTAVLESCMQTGLIQTNTGYDTLFEAATFKAQITDEDWHTRYASVPSLLDASTLLKAAHAPVLLNRNMLLKTNEIIGGHVAWQEDVTELSDTLEQLEENQQELEDENFLEQEALRTKQEVLRLQEKNRLYDLIGNHTRPQIELLDTLLKEYEETSGENARRRLLSKICVIGAYIKRCGNLLLIRESSETAPILELIKAMEESMQNLELSNAECGLTCTIEKEIPTAVMVEAYAFFEQIVEEAADRLDYLWVNLRLKGQELLLHMELEANVDLFPLVDSARIQHDDGVWVITACYKVGGDTI